jgi:hypothetical protein
MEHVLTGCGSKRKWQRMLARWFVSDELKAKAGPVSQLGKGECLYRAREPRPIVVQTHSISMTGEYVIATDDHLIIGLSHDGTSLAFVAWDAVVVIEVH